MDGLDEEWAKTVLQVKQYSDHMSKCCEAEGRALIASAAADLCVLPAPRTHLELARRHVAATHLTSKIARIAMGSSLARNMPHLADEILRRVRSFLDGTRDQPPYESGAELAEWLKDLYTREARSGAGRPNFGWSG